MMISLAKRMSRFEGGESMRKTNCVSDACFLGTGYTGECGKSKSLSQQVIGVLGWHLWLQQG